MSTTSPRALPDDPKPALVCVDDEDRRATVRASLEELGYQVQVPADAEGAIELLRKSVYEVVVLEERYEAAAPVDNAVLKALHAMPMSVRRYIFVALIADDVETLDHATAFARSVNAVVNRNDLGGLGLILRRAIADNDAFYRVFREVLQAAGKR
jgi:CheY-like chemotaxis protein